MFVSACVGKHPLMRLICLLSRKTFSISILRHELSALSLLPLSASSPLPDKCCQRAISHSEMRGIRAITQRKY